MATERGGPFTPDAVNRLIKRIGERAGFDFLVHVHMLRHACGFKLANDGVDTRTIQAISATGRSSIRFAIPSWRSKAYSETELLRNLAQKGPIFANDKRDPTPITQ